MATAVEGQSADASAHRRLRLSEPPRWLFHAAVGVPGLALLWATSSPFGYELQLTASLGLVALAAVWALRLVLCVRARRRDAPTGDMRWFLVAPLLGALTVALVVADVPLRVRWAAGEAAFEDAADQVLAEGAEEWTDQRRVGLFEVERVYVLENGVFFQSPERGFLTISGFARLPDGPNEDVSPLGEPSHTGYRHFTGDWYIWTWYF